MKMILLFFFYRWNYTGSLQYTKLYKKTHFHAKQSKLASITEILKFDKTKM